LVFKEYRKLWWALLGLIILSPLGLLARGTAFGEWGNEELQDRLGYVPAGLNRLSAFWDHVLLPDYAAPGLGGSPAHSAAGYVLSAVVGVLLVVAAIWLLHRLVGGRD
jgi:hypothetical protein